MKNLSRICSVVALAVAVFGGCARSVPNPNAENSASTERAGEQVVFAVQGMHCDGCAQAITETVQALPGVQAVKVSFADKRAVIVPKKEGFDPDAVVQAIQKMGYEAQAADRADAPARPEAR